MVAFGGFFQQNEVFVQFFLFRESDGIDTGQLFAFLVATPVSTGGLQQLDGLDGGGVVQVRASAEVGERAALIEGDRAVFQIVDQLQFVFVAFLGEVVQCFGFGHLAAHEFDFLGGQLLHFGFDFRKVIRRDAIIHEIDVVVEAVFDMGADAELDTGIKAFNGGGHQVGGAVPEHALAILVVPGQQLHFSVLIDGTAELHNLVVDIGCQHVACQSFADAAGNLVRRNTLVVLFDGTVR